MARGNKLTFLAEEGRIIDHEKHGHGGLVDGDGRQGLGILEIADGIANLELLKTDDSTDIATLHGIGTYVAHALEGVELLDLGLLHGTIAMGNGNLHAILQRATMYATHGDTALIAGVIE